MAAEKPAVIIDIGSYTIKAGFSCDNHPVCMFRTVVGRPSYLRGGYGRLPYDVYVGDVVIDNTDDLEVSHPVSSGEIVNWDNMERIWHHIYYKELKVAPEDRSVIVGCSVTSRIEEKIKCCEIFFETLNAPSLCIQPQCVLAMYASGITTGICVDIGYDTTDITPIYEGGVINYAHMQTQLAGSQLSDYLKGCFESRYIDFGPNTHEILEKIKRQYLYVTNNCAIPRKKILKFLKLPNGKIVEIGQESFMAGELFIQPELVFAVNGKKTNILAIQDAIVEAAMKCDSDLQMELYNGIVICGGLSLLPGLNERLTIELTAMLNRPINLITSPEGYAVSWLGGATFAGIPDTKEMSVKKSQFEDYGEKIVRKKFL